MLPQKFSNKRRHRKYRLRFTLRGTADRPRLSVFRSAKHIYAQVIDDDSGKTLAAASTMEKALAGAEGDKTAIAAKVGEAIVQRALDAGVRRMVFDRNGFIYHGRVAAVSKAAHAKGLLTKTGFTGTWPEPTEQAADDEQADAAEPAAPTESQE